MSFAGFLRSKISPARVDDPTWIRKEDAPCCVSHVDEDGRLPIGWCSPECVRRPRGTVRP